MTDVVRDSQLTYSVPLMLLQYVGGFINVTTSNGDRVWAKLRSVNRETGITVDGYCGDDPSGVYSWVKPPETGVLPLEIKDIDCLTKEEGFVLRGFCTVDNTGVLMHSCLDFPEKDALDPEAANSVNHFYPQGSSEVPVEVYLSFNEI